MNYYDSVVLSFTNSVEYTYYYCGYHLPSDFKEKLLGYRRSTISFFGCDNYYYYFYSSNNSFDDNAYAQYIRYDYKNNIWHMNDIFNPANNYFNNFRTFVISYPDSTVFDGSGNFTTTFSNRIKVNSNNYEDLMFSSQPSEIIISMLYVAIPLLLLVIGIKVLKKGLFK